MPGIKARRIEEMRTRDDLNSYRVKNTGSVRMLKYDILRCGAKVASSGAFFEPTRALAGTAGDGFIMVADSDILVDGTGIARRMYVIPFDTSGRALGDGVFLSAITPGALTFTNTGERVGWVSFVGTDGWVTVSAGDLNVSPGTVPAHGIDDHSDVDTSGVAVGDVLTWDGATWVPSDVYDLLDFNRIVLATSAFSYDIPNNWSEATLPSALDASAGVAGMIRLYVNAVSDLAYVASGTPLPGEWGISGTELRIGGDITGTTDTYKVIWPS